MLKVCRCPSKYSLSCLFVSSSTGAVSEINSAFRYLPSLSLFRSAQGIPLQSHRHSLSSVEASIISPHGEGKCWMQMGRRSLVSIYMLLPINLRVSVMAGLCCRLALLQFQMEFVDELIDITVSLHHVLQVCPLVVRGLLFYFGQMQGHPGLGILGFLSDESFNGCSHQL